MSNITHTPSKWVKLKVMPFRWAQVHRYTTPPVGHVTTAAYYEHSKYDASYARPAEYIVKLSNIVGVTQFSYVETVEIDDEGYEYPVNQVRADTCLLRLVADVDSHKGYVELHVLTPYAKMVEFLTKHGNIEVLDPNA